VSSGQKFGSETRLSDTFDVVMKNEAAVATYKFILEIRQRECGGAIVGNDKAIATFTKN
jgi:hypothetical protein